MKLLGITLITNGVELGYPFVQCIRNLSKCCDRVLVSTDMDANRDSTGRVLFELEEELGNISIIFDAWDWSVNNGTDLAERINHCMDEALSVGGFDSVLYVQADEIVSFEEINVLKNAIDFASTNVFLERTYFWKDLNHINKSWTMHLPRLCVLTKGLRVVEDGMSMKVDDKFPSVYVPNDVARIYHYSRVGDTKKIADRLNTLDSLFHETDSFSPIEEYMFGMNNNFESGAEKSLIEDISVKHPDGIEVFYNKS